MFTVFKKRRELKAKAQNLYDIAVAQARLPIFYEDYGVPDTVDGRFDMISLHCYLMMRKLRAQNTQEGKRLSQKLFDVFFVTMDRSLREMGVGDLGVPKHMKRMMQGFNGRAYHYESAIKNNDKAELGEALVQNIYGTVERPDDKILKVVADYVMVSAELPVSEYASIQSVQEQEKQSA